MNTMTQLRLPLRELNPVTRVFFSTNNGAKVTLTGSTKVTNFGTPVFNISFVYLKIPPFLPALPPFGSMRVTPLFDRKI